MVKNAEPAEVAEEYALTSAYTQFVYIIKSSDSGKPKFGARYSLSLLLKKVSGANSGAISVVAS